MMIRFIAFVSLLSLLGIAGSLIFGRTAYADFFGILTFCLYAVLVIVTVLQWFTKKE